jgi:hypothetical protein
MYTLRGLSTSAVLLILAVLSFTVGTVTAQIGVTLCACQPSVYTFTFNFTATCDDGNIEGPGIYDEDCTVSAVGTENATSLTPVQVSSIQILELDQNLQVIVQTPVIGTFLNGESFTYTSITATQSDVLNASSLPRGFQVIMTGVNDFDEFIRNTWIVLYDNDCGIFPIVIEGQQDGWTVLVCIHSFRDDFEAIVPFSLSLCAFACS